MAHHHVEVKEELYEFKPATRSKLYILLVVGIVFAAIGLFTAGDGSHEEGGHGGGHSAVATEKMVASVDQEHPAEVAQSHDSTSSEHAATEAEHGASDEHAAAPAHGAEHAAGQHAGGEHHGSPHWLKRLFTTLWMHNILFCGLGLIGLFFIAIQYAAQAGWSVGIKRVALAMGSWIPIAGILTLVLYFLVNKDIFHWSHSDVYDPHSGSFDQIISDKAPFFYWPLAGGSFPFFFILRMILFFGLWYWFYTKIRRNMLAEDLDNSTQYWYNIRGTSAWFLVFFGASSSIAAWDWVMSIDTHWFSTMFGWYVFASWWVTGLSVITLIVVFLKENGYLSIVNSNHLHDLGKFVWAFCIFWTYIWFGQFLLIYYAHIPEETVYFVERMYNSPYAWIFYTNIILNFVLPFLLLMTRDAKRQMSTLKVVCPIIIIGHWFDFYNMVTPGVMQHSGAVGFLEIGVFLIFASVFLLFVLNNLSKVPLFGKNDPMLEESLHHHI
ncbi:quinol:cytochrome C oxidoreductase [Chryseolinea sp. T2]|uniref:quinol:cytochrome C oxidoreductase n=1 Tax=Chryseolinea sp. T2 TaxID=3129255 RepID=UPI003077164B